MSANVGAIHRQRTISVGHIPAWVWLGIWVYALVLINGSQLLSDSDTYWQIATGKWILDHNALPHVDIYSFTKTGEPWISSSWLAQVLYAESYELGGWTGPIVLAATAIAASFALLVYTSAWLKHYEPAAFCAALVNSQPMGFYAPAQLVRDARAHGVEVRAADATVSGWDCTLERRDDGRPALRLGLRLVKHLSQEGAVRLLAARALRPFDGIADLAERAELDRRDLEALAAADAMARLAGHRHRAVWQVTGVERALPLLPAATAIDEGIPLLRAPREGQDIVADYGSLGLTLRRHPLALLRDKLQRRGVLPTQELWEQPNGKLVRTAGLVITRQRPGSAGGVTFVTMEDETGYVNLIVWNRIAVEQRAALLESRLLEVHGKLQREGDVQHVIAQRLTNLSSLLGDLMVTSRNFH